MDGENKQIKALIDQGMALFNSNRMAEARSHYLDITSRFPDNAEAWFLLSSINGRLGRIDEAGECCRRAIELRPDYSEAYVNLGNVLLSQQRFDEALEQYQTALRLNPRDAVTHAGLGNVLSTLSRHDEAVASYLAAIQLNPNFPEIYFNLGNVRMAQMKYDDAVQSYRQALRLRLTGAHLNAVKQQALFLTQHNHLEQARTLMTYLCQADPADADAWHFLGTLNGKLGNIEAVGDCCRRVLALQPDHGEAHVNLGHVFLSQGKQNEAFECYRKALKINPLSIPALNNLGKAHRTTNQFNEYVELYRKTVALAPDPGRARTAFIEIIDDQTPSQYEPWLDEELRQCFAIADVDHQPLALTTARLLRLKHGLHNLHEDNDSPIRAVIERIVGDELFIAFLEKTINTDPDMEVLLTKARRVLLDEHSRGTVMNPVRRRFVSALARQCLNNEYVFIADERERRLWNELKDGIERRAPAMHEPSDELELDLSLFAMYGRLLSLSCRRHLDGMPRAWSRDFLPLLEQALIYPLEEERIKGDIETIGGIHDETTRLVQSQYEENPYPRWLAIPELKLRKAKVNIAHLLKRNYPHFSPPDFLDGPLQLLVAGCGTGKHPIQRALVYNNTDVLGVDISKSSLAYAARMARDYEVENIRFMQGDILELSKLDRRFHIIECAGVLHHMEDPLAGWKILSDLLVESGLMSIALYSEKARKHIVSAREVIQNEKITPNEANIRDFRQRILKRELGDHLHELHKIPDFYSTSACRDLLFHFKEHRFTLPQLAEMLDGLNLKFIGFTFNDTKIRNLYREHFPEDTDMTNLALWDQLESMYPLTFTEMYHFWCQKT